MTLLDRLKPVLDPEVIRGTLADARVSLRAQVDDLRQGLRRPSYRDAMVAEVTTGLTIAPGALSWLYRTRPDATTTLLSVVLGHADKTPGALALEMGDQRLTYAELADKSSRIAHVLRRHGVQQGDVVALLSPNSPFYVAVVLAATRLGAVAALINTHLTGTPLAHALTTSGARVLIVDERHADAVKACGASMTHTLVHGKGPLDQLVESAPSWPLPPATVRTGDDFVLIYTSGTTGLPKPCKVTHGRTVLVGGLTSLALWELTPDDKIYCVLPLYHSSATLLAVSAAFAAGASVLLRESFSARNFWPEAARGGATAMIYIGEICRHLLHTPPCDDERRHRIRVAMGNGMRADVWEPFSRRFGIPTIREFYGATEAPGGIFNITNKVGSIGRLPLRHLLPTRLARYDVDEDRHVRDGDGYCVRCEPGEVGELLIKLKDAPLIALFEFRGYTDSAATSKKILTDVFHKGDRYYRTGDLLRVDEDGYFYFVDRIGDTFRWKGENVSTTEVAEVLGKAPGVKGVAVVGVHVPGMEGQAGLAALVTEGPLDVDAFWRSAQELPGYAQPRFVRVVEGLSTTSTHKIQKVPLRNEGVDPNKVSDPLFVRTDAGYQPLTPALWAKVTAGEVRL